MEIGYRNDYGAPADALLIVVDGYDKFFACKVPAGRDEIFVGQLAPGVHDVDVVFSFGGFGKGGRATYPLAVKAGKDASLTVVLDRDDHEQMNAHFESKRPPGP